MADEVMTNEANESAAEDELLGEIAEEETEEESVSLEAALTEDTGEQSGEDEQKGADQGTRSEPGYVKTRIDKAVAKAIAQTEARMQAMFEKQMAPYREQMITAEAQELVRTGKVKDLDTAKELVRYRQGQPRQETAAEDIQPTPAPKKQERDPETSARINILQHQADRIKEQRGIDVIAEFQKNEDVKQKVVSGEWDFYDVAEEMSKPKRKTPAPMRSPNGASGYQLNAIDSMTDEQFERLEKRIAGGARIALRK